VLVADRTGRWFPAFLPVLVVSVLGAAGCWSSYAEWADGETPEVVVPEDGGVAEDAPRADDAGVDDGGVDDGGLDDGGLDDGGTDDAGVDADGGLIPCDGGWYDPTSALCWQDPPAADRMIWDAAVTYCASLSLAGCGPGSWRLPTVSGLRSLIRGCPATETGGACGVTDECLGEGCGSWGPCNGCSDEGGPGVGRLYWPPEPAAPLRLGFWSSSSFSGSSSYGWGVPFSTGYVYNAAKAYRFLVRCIRRGP
jgi:hypothetical protein